MRQTLPGGLQLDLLTRSELGSELDRAIGSLSRSDPRGMKLMRMPITRAVGTGGTITIGGNPQADNQGPQQGYIWRLMRLMVASNSVNDSARYLVYSGSDPSATDENHLLDGQVGSPPFVFTPAVPASGTAQFNNSAYPSLVVVSGGTVSAVTVNGTPTGATSGGFYVPAGGSITLTYTVAPAWSWSNSFLGPGQLVNVAFRPGNKAEWIFPGEFPYCSVYNTISGLYYAMTGIAAEVPMEMVAKIL